MCPCAKHSHSTAACSASIKSFFCCCCESLKLCRCWSSPAKLLKVGSESSGGRNGRNAVRGNFWYRPTCPSQLRRSVNGPTGPEGKQHLLLTKKNCCIIFYQVLRALGLQTRHLKLETLRWPQLLAVPPGSFFQLAAFLASEEVQYEYDVQQ